MHRRLFSCSVALSAILVLVGCNPQTRSTAGQTPNPSKTTLAQANSTAAPGFRGPISAQNHYYARSSSNLHGVTFSLWSNGTPLLSFSAPNMTLDLTQKLRAHANTIAIQWERTARDGTGTLTVYGQGKTIAREVVTPRSPAKGSRTVQMFANP